MRINFTSLIQRRSARRCLWFWGLLSLALILSLGSCASHHFVRTDKGWVVVNKRFVGILGTCADVRGWKWADVVAHPDLSQALIQAGYSDVLPKEPTLLDKTIEKTKQVAEEVISKGTNAWQSLKTKMSKTNSIQTATTP